MAQVIKPYQETELPEPSWHPSPGPFYQRFIKDLDDDAFDSATKERIDRETLSILGACHNPDSPEPTDMTGAVIGYVQSGKTTSFNALTMLAIDNGFTLIIVLGGRTKSLLEQNTNEFKTSLKYFVDREEAIVKGPSISKIKDLPISKLVSRGTLFNAMPIISVHLKHQTHIANLSKLLKSYQGVIANQNVLIIDDEADNAGLNSQVNSNNFHSSAVYQSIKDLRSVLPRYSYIQYTATPQALLLTSRNDHMSPSWVRFITPGDNYIGTSEIFSPSSLSVMQIPPDDLALQKGKIDLPDSFFNAFRTFLLSAAQATSRRKEHWGSKNITLMVHPHRETKYQDAWGLAISSYLVDCKYEISGNQKFFLKKNENTFKKSYEHLRKASEELTYEIDSFESLYDCVPAILEELSLTVLNRSSRHSNILSREVDWGDKYHLVIGGDLLDRGYVVRGLVTTYMPRTPSTNADTLQQRGRFYGYKKQHFNFIKIWLSQHSIEAFQSYLESEQYLYATLKAWTLTNTHLSEWKREILLSPKLEPCRRSIIGIDIIPNAVSSSGWSWPRRPLKNIENEEVVSALIKNFSDKFSIPSDADTWTDAMKYMRADNLDLLEVMNLLYAFSLDPSDQPKWLVMQALIGTLISKDYSASIFLMGTSSLKLSDFTSRKRKLKQVILKEDEEGAESESYEFIDPFQGKNDRYTYPGARCLFNNIPQTITFQIHRLTLTKTNGDEYLALVPIIKMPLRNGLLMELHDDNVLLDDGFISESD